MTARRSRIFKNAPPGEDDPDPHPRGRDVVIEWTPGRRRYIEDKIDDRTGEPRGFTCQEWEDAWYHPGRTNFPDGTREILAPDATGAVVDQVVVVSSSVVPGKGDAEIVWMYRKGNKTSIAPVTIYPPEDAAPAGLMEKEGREGTRQRREEKQKRRRRGEPSERPKRRGSRGRGRLEEEIE